MKFRLVSDDELDHVRNLDSAAAAIRRKATVLFEQLGKEFNQAQPGGITGVEFTAPDSPRSFGAVKTPFGNGRLRLMWIHDGEQLLGEVLVDREVFDQRDRQYWEPVYSFLLREQGAWTPRNKGEHPHYMNGDSELKNWALGASIVYSILKGPVVD